MKQFTSILSLMLMLLFQQSFATENPCIGPSGGVEWMRFYGAADGRTYLPAYPHAPDELDFIQKLETPEDYNDHYFTLIRGYLKVPEDGEYIFGVSGRDHVEFYFSPDEDPENMTLLLSASYAAYDDFDKNPEQLDTLSMTAGKYHYFEIHHQENTSKDHLRIAWKMPDDKLIWKTIDGKYLHSFECQEYCAPKGTPCNDGNPETVNDVHDGACNCFGLPETVDDCVGNRNEIHALFYDNIQGGELTDLTSAPSFPLQPSRVQVLDMLRLANQNNFDDFGSSVKAFLYIPVSGTYEFGAIGNTEAELFMSTTGNNSDFVLIGHSSGYTSSMQLETGQILLVNLLHKEKAYAEEFAAIWKTPFSQEDAWKYIDGNYLLGYQCELACFPEGTPCDDKDSLTIHDAYDGNCNCTGGYCPDGDCPESLEFPPYDACAPTTYHSTHPEDSWLSCSKHLSPIDSLGNQHWIQYDFGSVMPIGNAHIWNYNVHNQTGRGFRDVRIDFSVDGESWKKIGDYEWSEASGDSKYSGFPGPDFTGHSAQFVLITGLTNWNNDDCAGFSEIKFAVATCPDKGTPCDDQNNFTGNDRYNDDCECLGSDITGNPSLLNAKRLKVFPNPAKQWTNIVFYLEEAAPVSISIYDLNGRLILNLLQNEKFQKGVYQKAIPAQNFEAGQYLIKYQSADFIRTEKMRILP